MPLTLHLNGEKQLK